MKKIFLFLVLVSILFLTGCGNHTKEDVINDLSKKINGTKSYYIEGKMTINNNEDTYEYDVKVSYQQGDFYKVNLTNLTNDHEQIILRNDEGVYVVTPSLNKSFKFQSEWPYNNSQVYLLKSIIDDIKNDDTKTYEEKDGYYIFTNKVNYPNNKKLVKQIVFIDKNLNIKETQVVDNDNNIQIRMKFDKIDLKKSFDKDYFAIDNNLQTSEDTIKETSSIDDVIYPMYLPVNTYLIEKDVMETANGERLILTFDGDSPFTLIEETVKIEKEHTIIPSIGEIDFVLDTIACISDNSVNWVSNGIEYYVISNIMEKEELLEVARSISVIPVSK